MEEMMMVMMKIRSDGASSNTHQPNIPSTTTHPTWKLYENPFFISHQKSHQYHHELQNRQEDSSDQRQIHRLHLPISTRKIAASFWDLTFIKPFMESELELARAEITLLKAELGYERKARKKMEFLNKRLARELNEVRKRREALEQACKSLAREISSDKAEIRRMLKEMQEERKMLRLAEVIKEERMQMKLTEAKNLLEEKFYEVEIAKKEADIVYDEEDNADQTFCFAEKLRFVLGEKQRPQPAGDNIENVHSLAVMQRRSSPEAENPHVRQGIKGFVEFRKVVQAVGCRSSKHLCRNLECQKAQLKKGPGRFNGLIAN